MRIAVIALIGASVWAQEAKNVCPCPGEAGDGEAAPLLTINGPGGAPELGVCGSLLKRTDQRSLIGTELSVIACRSGETLVEVDGQRRAVVAAEPDRLLITEMTQWPFGADWRWIDVSLRKYVVTAAEPPVVTEKTVLTPPSLSSAQIKQVLADFESLRKSKLAAGDGAKLLDMVGRLLTAALTGDAAAVEAFRAMDKWLESLEPYSAECAERYDDAREVYKIYTESNSTLRAKN